MKSFTFIILLALTSLIEAFSLSPFFQKREPSIEKRAIQGCPKVVIISMFDPEAAIWYGKPEFNVFEKNITIPGLSPLYPDLHCTSNYDVCQVTIGEAESNAGPSLMALTLYPDLNFTKTYFMVAGIAGVNPEVGTLGSVGIGKYAVQVALSYEIDAREKPENWTFGYAPFGGNTPGQYPSTLYGTEVFELNEALRDFAFQLTSKSVLNDSSASVAYRALYQNVSAYAAGAAPPSVIKADSLCSDVWFSGQLLSSSFGNYTKLITNGSGIYGFTAEEESASFEALLRAAKAKLIDFSRIILLRSGSDFDRQPPSLTAYDNLFTDVGAFLPSLANLYIVGSPIIRAIITDWNATFLGGIPANNYVGDIFGSLGGTPDFGPGPITEPALRKRSLRRRSFH